MDETFITDDELDETVMELLEPDIDPSAIEEMIGEILDSGEGFEEIPDLVMEILEGEPFENIPWEEIPEEENNESGDDTLFRSSQGSGMQNRRSNDTYSKFDSKVEGIQISADKLQEIRISVAVEGWDKKWAADAYEKKVQERVDELSQKLSDIRSDIEHYKGLIDSINKQANPAHLRSVTSFQLLRYEIDAACRNYVKAGGAVGADCFLKDVGSAGQLGMSMVDVFRTNALEGAITKRVLNIDLGYKDIYAGTKMGASVMGKIASPFIEFSDKVGFTPGSYLGKLFDHIDNMEVTNDKPEDVDAKPEDTVTTDDLDTSMEEDITEEIQPDDIGKPEESETDVKETDDPDKPEDKTDASDEINPKETDAEEPSAIDYKESAESMESQQIESEETTEHADEIENPSAELSNDVTDTSSEPSSVEEEMPNDDKTDVEPEEEKDSPENLLAEEDIEQPDPDEKEDILEEKADVEDDSDADSSENPEESEVDEEEKSDADEEKSDLLAVESDEDESGLEEDSEEDVENPDNAKENPVDSDSKDEPDRLEEQADDLERKTLDDDVNDAESQNDSLTENEDLAVQRLPTDEEEHFEYVPDHDEQMMDIVDNTVKAIEDGLEEKDVLYEAASDIAEFYEAHITDDATPVEDTVGRIADGVHEMASVFEIPESAMEELLKGIPDDAMTDAIHQQIEVVDAEMTTDATGAFGSLEYDDSGNVFDRVDTPDSEELFEIDRFDLDSTISSLEMHMEQAVEAPDVQDLIANDIQTSPEGIEIGTDSGIDAGLSGIDAMSGDIASGIEESTEIIMTLL